MGFSSFLNLSRLFTLDPAPVGGLLGQIILGFFLVMFVIGIVVHIRASNRDVVERYVRQMASRTAALFITMGILGVLIYFFSFEQVRFFGARFWYLLWLIGLVFWAWQIIRFVKRDVPALKARDDHRAMAARYMPPRKK